MRNRSVTPSSDPSSTRHPVERSVVRVAMTRFLILGGITFVVVALLTVPMASTVARAIARIQAEERTLTFTRTIAVPDMTGSGAISDTALAIALEHRLTDRSISHAALYDAEGRVLWSADPAAIGLREELDPAVTDLFGGTGAVSHFSTSMHAGGGEAALVLEVYAVAVGADGEPFVMEWYWPTSQMAQSVGRTMVLLLPLTLGSLLLFAALILPLTLSTARRVERDRARLTRHAMQASRVERRRLSEDLHDGVVQDLSGIGYILPMLGRALPPGSSEEALLSQVQQTIRRDISTIRATIADIRPIDLRGDGFREAIGELATRMESQGVETTVELDCDVDSLTPMARALVYRTLREAARNVVRHSRAQHAHIAVTGQASLIRVSVRDDGVGPGEAADLTTTREAGDPHFGLALLAEAISDLDGELELRPVAGGGTEFVALLRRTQLLS